MLLTVTDARAFLLILMTVLLGMVGLITVGMLFKTWKRSLGRGARTRHDRKKRRATPDRDPWAEAGLRMPVPPPEAPEPPEGPPEPPQSPQGPTEPPDEPPPGSAPNRTDGSTGNGQPGR